MGYDFDPQIIPKNIEYYLKRCSNGSTLSNIVLSWVLARSDRTGSWNIFNKALESDISDIQGGTTHEGIHLGAMAGTVDILQQCYTGIAFCDEMLHLNPKIPEGLQRLMLKIKYRGNWFDINITPDALAITSSKERDIITKICFREKIYEIKPGDTLNFDIKV